MSKASRIACLGVAACAIALALPPAARGDTVANGFASLAYRPIGPAISGGRATAVAGSDVDPSIYYAGGADGGVWKSLDGGTSWRPVFDREPVAAIGTIAVAQHDPADVWVGTGEANPRNDAAEGAGIWPTDGGKQWRHAGLDDGGAIASISIDPRDRRTVVVGVLGHSSRDSATRGVFVTHDAGAHWKRALFAGSSSGVSDLARVPDRPATLFAGVWQFRREPWRLTSGGPAGGLYRSDDGGENWRRLTGRGLPNGLIGRIGIAAATHGRVYAIVRSKQGDIWRSDDGGVRWQVMPHSAMIGARPFYFSHLFVDPANRNRVMSVSLDRGRHWSQPYALPFSQLYHLGTDSSLPSYAVCIGLQDNNAWCGPSTSDNGVGVLNRDWYTVGPGDGMWVSFDPADPNLVWTTGTNSGTGQANASGDQRRSDFAGHVGCRNNRYDLPDRSGEGRGGADLDWNGRRAGATHS